MASESGPGAAGDELYVSKAAAEFMLAAGVPLVVLLVCIV